MTKTPVQQIDHYATKIASETGVSREAVLKILSHIGIENAVRNDARLESEGLRLAVGPLPI
jgi:hypothetical protein